MRTKRGLRGHPVATVALYGPDDTKATKLTVGIVPAADAEATTFDAGSPKGPISAMMPA
jgi:hypothetical protein